MFGSRAFAGIVVLCIAIGFFLWVDEPMSAASTQLTVADTQLRMPADASEIPVTAPNADAAKALTPADVCYTRAELTADPEAELARQWQSRNLIDPIDLPAQARGYTVAQLEAEADSGDVDAMYKLGVKYLWAGMQPSRDPHLNVSPLTPAQQQLYADKSRFWFWQAALHGRLQAFLELSVAFTSMHNDKHDLAPAPEISPLTAAYQLLMLEINPDFARALGVRAEQIWLKDQDKAQVAPLLAALRSQWQQQRQELGQPFQLDLQVPDYVKTFEQKLAQLCASQW